MKRLQLLSSVLFGLTIVSAITWLTYFNGYANTKDWWTLRNYQPSPVIAEIVDQSEYTETARTAFYITNPQLTSDASSFNKYCFNDQELTVVLGCYTSDERIYLYDVDDARIPYIEEVTATHEMLHSAYERLSNSEREDLNALLKNQESQLKDTQAREHVALYQQAIFGSSKDQPNYKQTYSYYSELHSIFGTELVDLTPELEKYYGQYFDNRSMVVDLFQQHSQVFTGLKDKIDAYDKQLEDLDNKITGYEEQLNSYDQQLVQLNDLMQELYDNQDLEQYNNRVGTYNTLVDDYNSLIASYKEVVEGYNRIVDLRQKQAYIQNDLSRSLDSKYQEKKSGL